MLNNSNIVFDKNAKEDQAVEGLVLEFMGLIQSLEDKLQSPLVVFQDGKSQAYYIKCTIIASDASNYCDLNAKLDINNEEAFRANRELLLKHKTYRKMQQDAQDGREFNDIIAEYSTVYELEKPLKVWGGQHRIRAIIDAVEQQGRYHGFKIYFDLSKDQRTEVALISNTNISVSNDTFDRMVEETIFGDVLRQWCETVGLLPKNENFPDVGSTSEYITVKLTRTFIVNYYRGKELGSGLSTDELDKRVYEPYVAVSGISADPEYEKYIKANDILDDEGLVRAGKEFVKLHKVQGRTVTDKSTLITNRKSYRNKAFVISVLCGWSYVSGLLQNHPERLENHYEIPKTSKNIPDPLNAAEMSQFRHDKDAPTYRGLGTRPSLKDRQRLAQLFLAKSIKSGAAIDKKLMNQAVSKVVGLNVLKASY